jgi:hypothetical protein
MDWQLHRDSITPKYPHLHMYPLIIIHFRYHMYPKVPTQHLLYCNNNHFPQIPLQAHLILSKLAHSTQKERQPQFPHPSTPLTPPAHHHQVLYPQEVMWGKCQHHAHLENRRTRKIVWWCKPVQMFLIFLQIIPLAISFPEPAILEKEREALG